MNENIDPKAAEFARRAALLLTDSAKSLSAAQLSRLTQARYRALDQYQHRADRSWWQRLGIASLAPLGGVAAAGVLALVLFTGRDPDLTASGSAFEDLEILADADALELTADADPEFYEWAALQAEVGSAGALGT